LSTVKIPLLVGTSGGTPVTGTPQRVYNYFPTIDNSTKSGIVWKNTPGWDTWATITNGINRKAEVFLDKLYVINGKTVVQVENANSAKAQIEIGFISATTGQVNMAQDGISLLISDGHQMSRWDGTTFSTVVLPFSNPTGVVFHDGHFIALEGRTGRFWISDKFDGDTWNSLQFATAEDKPDNIQQLGSDRTLFLFGKETTQPYINNGTAFPFVPNQQGRMIYGIEGQTWAQMDNTSIWLARSKEGGLKVVKANGYTPQAISTPSIENEFALLSKTSDAYANSIMWQGHEWYILTFPTAKRTFVFDSNNNWFEWSDWNDDDSAFIGHPALDFVYFDGSYLFVDGTGAIKELKTTLYAHGDNIMSSEFSTAVQHIDEQRVYLYNLIIDMTTGVGEDAIMELAISSDGGRSWGPWVERTLGAIGQYEHRVQWHHMGSGYNMVIKARITDEVPREITRGILDVGVQQSYLERRNQRAGVPTPIQ
jgi:hypothetical protein